MSTGRLHRRGGPVQVRQAAGADRPRARAAGHRGRAARRRPRVDRRRGGVRRERRGRPGRHPRLRPRPDGDPLHQRQERLRDRGQRADVGGARDPVRRGRGRPGRGLRQAPARRVRPASRGLGAARGVRRSGADGDHAVLRHQDRPLPARAPHLGADPGPGRREGLPQRRPEPERLAPRAGPGRRDRRRRHGQRPADPADVLLARRGWRRDHPHQRRRGRPHRARRAPARCRDPHPPLRLLRGLQPLDPGHRPPLERQLRCRRSRLRGRRRRPRRGRRGAAAGHRERRGGHASRRVRVLQGRRAGGDGGRRGDRDRRPAAGQHRRRLHRERRADRSLGPAPGARDRHPAPRRGRRASGRRTARIGFTHVYGAPGISACTVLAV